MKLEIIVCDICQDPSRDAQHFSISVDDDTMSTDLCDEHAQPIMDTLTAAQEATQESRAATAKQSRTSTKKSSQQGTQQGTQRSKQAPKAPKAEFSESPQKKPARARKRAGGLAATTIEDIEKSKQG